MRAPDLLARLAIAACAMLGSGTACALGGQNMVLGRMVAARPDAPTHAPTSSPRARYVLHCAGCHGLDGAGSEAGHVPDMRRLSQWLRVPGGREYVIKVPGVMGSGLNDAQVAEVTNWVLTHLVRDALPAGHQPFEAAEVARARTAPLADVAAERQRLLQRARALGIYLY